ncbi:unnamed protein product [Spodoptera exigua]|nr:unnamed protein product [Spodoptera exigua]
MGDKLVWLTGFGPFEGALVNDSWVGVKQMPTQCIKKEFGAVVLKQRIPVKYSFVDYFIPYRWAVLQPDLTIHVGVSNAVDCFTLETQAYKSGYTLSDVEGRTPSRGINSTTGPDVLRTNLDVDGICKDFNDLNLDGGSLQARVSNDPGRFLCSYIYYTSLGHGVTLFVHVPLNKYSPDQLGCGLSHIVQLTLSHMNQHK